MDVEEGFTAYVSQRRLTLFRTACLLCGDPHQAEDIVQDALARLYAAWPRASRADDIDGYARRTIINSQIQRVLKGSAGFRRESMPVFAFGCGDPVNGAGYIRARVCELGDHFNVATKYNNPDTIVESELA